MLMFILQQCGTAVISYRHVKIHKSNFCYPQLIFPGIELRSFRGRVKVRQRSNCQLFFSRRINTWVWSRKRILADSCDCWYAELPRWRRVKEMFTACKSQWDTVSSNTATATNDVTVAVSSSACRTCHPEQLLLPKITVAGISMYIPNP